MWHILSASFAACLLFAALASQVQGKKGPKFERIIGGQKAEQGMFPWTASQVQGKKGPKFERIIGGQEAEQGMFPWTVALFYKDNFICTASVISSRAVLTAAYCVVIDGVVQPAELYYGIAGNVNKSSPVYRIDFASLTPHPEYNSTTSDNDLAILTTDQPIPFSENLQPICIAGPDSDTQYRTAIAMGWGRTDRFGFVATHPDILQYADVRIIPNTQCQALNSSLNNRKLCANGLSTGSCNGDSGGPLVHIQDIPIEIGIVSYGDAINGCGFLSPTVFTRVSTYNDFIEENAAGEPICVYN